MASCAFTAAWRTGRWRRPGAAGAGAGALPPFAVGLPPFAAEEDEEDILDKAFDVRMESRLGCQSKIERDGLLKVRISKESVDAYYNEHPEKRGS